MFLKVVGIGLVCVSAVITILLINFGIDFDPGRSVGTCVLNCAPHEFLIVFTDD